MNKLSEKLQDFIRELEIEIKNYIKDNKFYLDFDNKGWSESSHGQNLMYMEYLCKNLRCEIQSLRDKGL